MRAAGGALAVMAALIICTHADPNQDQEGSYHGATDHYNVNGHKSQNSDTVGGGMLNRAVRDTRNAALPSYYKQLDSLRPYSGYYADIPKRIEQLDRSSYSGGLLNKRNYDFDDSFPYAYSVKRYYPMYGSNYLDMPIESFGKKRNRPDFPMDEIDLSHFPIGSKRSMENFHLAARARR